MFESRNQIRFDLLAYLLMIVGTLGDWISTTIGLAQPHIMEGNIVARSLMNKGLWMPVDMVLVVICIIVPYLVNKFVDHPIAKAFLVCPLIAGLLKIGVSFWNMSLILA